MTQPPDDRPRPDEPAGDASPENAPTVAWTPPEPPDTPADEGGVGYAAIPEDGDAEGTAPAEGTPPAETPAPPPAMPPLEPPPSPIISSAPVPPAGGWQTPAPPPAPGEPATPPPTAPGSGWEVPAAPPPATGQPQGYVIAGIGARFVAFLIDITIVGAIPFLLTMLLFDWAGLFREAFEQIERDPTGEFAPTDMTIPVTLDYILVTLIGLGIQFLYFVGFWTSRWQGTPGMIGLKMRVVDAASGATLSLFAATKRWIALGWPLGLLALIPALQSAQGLLLLGLWIFVFFTTATNDRRQGLHDRWAGSLVIRSATSGDGATFIGCLVWGVLIILLLFVFWAVLFAAMAPSLQEYIEAFPTPPA